MNLPAEVKLSPHARMRLEERKSNIEYNTYNLMKSSVKWYNKDDLIPYSSLYKHCCYVTRKSNQIGYITDGNIEVIYGKTTHVAITVLEFKEKLKPINQFIKPEVLRHIEIKKENQKMKKVEIGTCPDCGHTNVEVRSMGMYKGLCSVCMHRIMNSRSRGTKYTPYVQLSPKAKLKIDTMQEAQRIKHQQKKAKEVEETVSSTETKTIPVTENYYQIKAESIKAENNPNTAVVQTKTNDEVTIKNDIKSKFDPLSDTDTFINILRSCGCKIPQENLNSVLNILTNTDKLKNIFMEIAKNDSQQAMLDLEQALNVVERKLQHDWEYNGFQETDDIKFKGFLTWRRVLKGAIFFWKKLYQTNCIIEMQRAWNAYTQDPNDKILLAGDKIESTMKRYQITTESISTILNTKRPFTRVFYAKNKETAYELFVKWMSDRNLHESKSKTTIVEI